MGLSWRSGVLLLVALVVVEASETRMGHLRLWSAPRVGDVGPIVGGNRV